MHGRLSRWRELLFPGNWEIAGYFGDALSAKDILAATQPVIVLEGPTGVYYADPIVFKHNGRIAIFFEEYVHIQRKGRLVAQEIDAKGRLLGPPLTIVQEEWHMSFPYLVMMNGVLYLLPECAESGTILAYPCIDFPFRWGAARLLIAAIDGVDTTLIPSGDTVFLITSERGGGGADDRGKVSVFSASMGLFPEGPWQQVPVGQGGGGRNAGPPIDTADGWIRPSQISADSYGEKISLNAVSTLTTTLYEEREIETIGSSGYPISHMHTLSSIDGFFVIDRKRVGVRPTIKAYAGRIQRLIGRMRSTAA